MRVASNCKWRFLAVSGRHLEKFLTRGPGKWRFIADGSRRLLCCRAFAKRRGSAGELELQVKFLGSVGTAFDEDVVQRTREVAGFRSWLLEAAGLQGLHAAQW